MEGKENIIEKEKPTKKGKIVEKVIGTCLNCAFSRDWCCEKKRRKQYITCVVDMTGNPAELHHNSNCPRWKLKENN